MSLGKSCLEERWTFSMPGLGGTSSIEPHCGEVGLPLKSDEIYFIIVS